MHGLNFSKDKNKRDKIKHLILFEIVLLQWLWMFMLYLACGCYVVVSKLTPSIKNVTMFSWHPQLHGK